jgi:hypothetical protein
MGNVVDMTWRLKYRRQLAAWRLKQARRRRPSYVAMPPPPEMFGDLTPEEILRETRREPMTPEVLRTLGGGFPRRPNKENPDA